MVGYSSGVREKAKRTREVDSRSSPQLPSSTTFLATDLKVSFTKIPPSVHYASTTRFLSHRASKSIRLRPDDKLPGLAFQHCSGPRIEPNSASPTTQRGSPTRKGMESRMTQQDPSKASDERDCGRHWRVLGQLLHSEEVDLT